MAGPGSCGQVIHFLRTGERLPDPSLAEQLAIVLRALSRAMLAHYGSETGMRIARKHLGWYSKGLPGSGEFRAAVNRDRRAGRGHRSDPPPSTRRSLERQAA